MHDINMLDSVINAMAQPWLDLSQFGAKLKILSKTLLMVLEEYATCAIYHLNSY